MKKKKQLEKKVFYLFFLLVFTIFSLLSFFSWQVALYFINKSEEAKIDETRTEAINFTENIVSNLSSNFDNIENQLLLSNKDNWVNRNRIRGLLNYYDSRLDKTVLYLYDNNNNMVYGTPWDLISKYEESFFEIISHKTNFHFITSVKDDLYLYYLKRIKDQTDTVIGYFLAVKMIETRSWSLPNNQNIILSAYIRDKTVDFFSDLSIYQSRLLRRKIENTVQHNKSHILHRVNYEKSLSITFFYDILNQPKAIVYFFSPRELNKIAHQSLLIFLLFVFAFLLLTIAISGAWFSKAILQPIFVLNSKMKEISRNPENLKPLGFSYSGILGEMTDSFNIMNNSIKNYAQSLVAYKVILNNIDTGIVWTDFNLSIILVNPAFFKIFNISDDFKITGYKLDYLFESMNIDIINQEMLNYKTKNIEITFSDKKKYLRHSLLTVKPLSDETNVNYIFSFTDISKETKESKARESLELELIKSNRLSELGSRVEGIVHNLNSPLNTILGYSQLLQNDYPNNQDILKIIDSGKVISYYVKGLLSKLKETNISMRRPVDVNEVINQELEMCEYDFFFKNSVKIHKTLNKEIPKIFVIFADISLVIANILSNAIHALVESDRKEIHLKTDYDVNFIIIEICDTGIGIEDKHLENIFEPSFSTKKDKENSDGFGLGLAICQNIIRKYKGKIVISSQLKQGTCIRILFPFKEQ